MSAWRVPTSGTVEEMVSAGESIAGMKPSAFAGQTHGSNGCYGYYVPISTYHYIRYEKPLVDRGWTPCYDPATGLPKVSVNLCPPGENGLPTA